MNNIKIDKYGDIKNDLKNEKNIDLNEEDIFTNIINNEGFIYDQDSDIDEGKIIRIKQEKFDNFDFVNEVDGINRCINK